VDIWLLVVH